MTTQFDSLKPSDGQNFEFVKIQDGGRPPSWNRKIAISWQRLDRSSRNLARWHTLTSQPHWTKRDGDCRRDLCVPKKHVLVVGAYWCLLVNTIQVSVHGGQGWAVQKQLNWSRCRLQAQSCGPNKPCVRWRCILRAHWTIHLQLQWVGSAKKLNRSRRRLEADSIMRAQGTMY